MSNNDNLPDRPWTLGEYYPPIEPRLSDNELVSKWVQAMACFISTKHPDWEACVAALDTELCKRRLGRRRLNVQMVD